MRNSGAFKVRVGEEDAEINREMLDAHWMITVSEAAATPMAEAQRRAEANEILPKLTELLTIIEGPDSSALTKAAMKQMYSYYHDLYQLPGELALERLMRLAEDEEEPQPEEPLPEDPLAGGMPPIGEDILAAEQASMGGAAELPPIGQDILAAEQEATIG